MEYHTKTNVLTTEKFEYFRASGLFDSPLYAATIMGVYRNSIILVGTRMALSLQCAARLLLVVFSLCDDIATGGRASLFATIFLLAACYVCVTATLQLKIGYFKKAGLIYFALAIPIVTIAVAAFFKYGLL